MSSKYQGFVSRWSINTTLDLGGGIRISRNFVHRYEMRNFAKFRAPLHMVKCEYLGIHMVDIISRNFVRRHEMRNFAKFRAPLYGNPPPRPKCTVLLIFFCDSNVQYFWYFISDPKCTILFLLALALTRVGQVTSRRERVVIGQYTNMSTRRTNFEFYILA